MYEPRHTRPLTRRQFARRVAAHFALATALVAVSLAGGMGPVHAPVTDGGKVFAGGFALYAGLVFLVVAGLVLAPIVHRLMHRLHWDAEESGK